MPYVYEDLRRGDPRSAQTVPSSRRDVLTETFAQAYEENPLKAADRFIELSEDQVTGPFVSAESARARLKDAGIDDVIVTDTGITEAALNTLMERKRIEKRRQDVLSRAQGGVVEGAERLGIAVATSLADPLGAGLNFVPVVGEVRYARWLAASKTLLGRVAVRAAAGAIEGAAGNALAEIPVYAMRRQEQADYDMADSLLNVAFGGIAGAGLHVTVGSIAELFARRLPAPVAQPPPARTWDNLEPGQQVTLYRGESRENVQGGQWWTTDRAKAEKYGEVSAVTLPAEVIGRNAARGAGGADEFIFQNRAPPDLATETKGAAPAASEARPGEFPVMGYGTIPRDLAEEAYAAYARANPGIEGTQSLDDMAVRGGFHTAELDRLVPDWRARAAAVSERLGATQRAVDTLPPEVRQAALRAAVGQAVEGRPIDVSPVLRAAPPNVPRPSNMADEAGASLSLRGPQAKSASGTSDRFDTTSASLTEPAPPDFEAATKHAEATLARDVDPTIEANLKAATDEAAIAEADAKALAERLGVKGEDAEMAAVKEGADLAERWARVAELATVCLVRGG